MAGASQRALHACFDAANTSLDTSLLRLVVLLCCLQLRASSQPQTCGLLGRVIRSLYEAKCSVDKHGSTVPPVAEFIGVRPKGFDGVIFSVNHLADGKTRFFNPIEKMQCV